VRSGGTLPERRRRPKGAAPTPTAETPAPVPVNTLTTVLDVYERQKGHTLRSWPHGRTRITRVFGALFSRPLAALTLGDLQLATAHPARPASPCARCTLCSRGRRIPDGT